MFLARGITPSKHNSGHSTECLCFREVRLYQSDLQPRIGSPPAIPHRLPESNSRTTSDIDALDRQPLGSQRSAAASSRCSKHNCCGIDFQSPHASRNRPACLFPSHNSNTCAPILPSPPHASHVRRSVGTHGPNSNSPLSMRLAIPDVDSSPSKRRKEVRREPVKKPSEN